MNPVSKKKPTKIINYLEFLGEAKGDFPGVRLIRGLVPILDLRGSGGAK